MPRPPEAIELTLARLETDLIEARRQVAQYQILNDRAAVNTWLRRERYLVEAIARYRNNLYGTIRESEQLPSEPPSLEDSFYNSVINRERSRIINGSIFNSEHRAIPTGHNHEVVTVRHYESPPREPSFPIIPTVINHQKCEIQLIITNRKINVNIASERHTFSKTIITINPSALGLLMRRELYNNFRHHRHAQPSFGLQLVLAGEGFTKILETKEE